MFRPKRNTFFMRLLVLFVLFGLLTFKANAQAIVKLTPEQFQQTIQQNQVQLIDLRPAGAFITEHIPAADNIDIQDRKFQQEALSLNKQLPTLLYCENGKRSIQAVQEFKKLGFENIQILNGGWEAWQKNKLNTTTSISKDGISNIKLTEFEELINANKLTLVNFTADWCLPCKLLKPKINKLAIENEQLKIVFIDVDKNQSLANHFNIASIPHLHFYRDGKLVRINNGLFSEKELKKFIR